MADSYINGVGVAAIRDWANGKFALDADLDTLAAEVDEIIAEGGEPNVIETVKVDGTALVPDAQKAVDIDLAGNLSPYTRIESGDDAVNMVNGIGDINIQFTYNRTNSTMEVESSAMSPDPSPLATVAYVNANGGKIDTISVNNTPQTITNKNVNITVPTAVSDLTNDSGYQTSANVSSAISTALANGSDPYQTGTQVDSKIASAVTSVYKFKGHVPTYADLPSTGQVVGDVWDVRATGVNYAWDGTSWDELGPYVDTSTLWSNVSGQTNSLVAMTVAEVNAILEPSA